jgi:hypothetical protein
MISIMRWTAIGFACALSACQFEHRVAGDVVDDPGGSIPPDAAPLPCAMKRTWTADFSADPTTLNLNGDPVADWRIREGGVLPGALADGVWSIDGPIVSLDTQPKTDFNRRMRATTRMRNTAMGTRGVVLALNVDYSPMTYMPLSLEISLDAEHERQTATLFAKDGASQLALATFPDLTTEMVDVLLDIDPMQNTVTVAVGATSSLHAYAPIPREMNDDRFATLVAYSAAEIDDARIELCQ